MRFLGHPHLERRVEGFGPIAFPTPPSSGGACVEGAPPKIGLEALTLPASRELMAVGHDYYQKAPMKMNISCGGVCIFMLGVLLSCDPAAYVRPVAHASYLFRAGGANSDSIRRYKKRDRDDIIYVRTAPHGVDPTSNQVFDQGMGEFPLPLAGQPGCERCGNGLPNMLARVGVSIE
ncbi:hypothetical protein HAX54_013999 [Datura stramonium]|uniref:Uncharacterized protein n=1 Tax=Datura stramonium TaxID=4076 RepID=A0ABS8TP54_DATST|nr:hypothetical protein [Datura stramonium]